MERKNTLHDFSLRLKGSIKQYLPSYAGDAESNKQFDGEMTKRLIKTLTPVGRCLFFVLTGALFGSAKGFMGSYPFGIGLLCAAQKYTVYVYAGLIITSIFSGAEIIPMLASSTVAFGMRIVIAKFLDSRGDSTDSAENTEASGMLPYRVPRYFTEPLGFRTAAAVMGSFAGGIIRIVFGGFLYYDLFGTVFQMVVAPAVCFLLSGVIDKERRYTVFYETGICTAVFIFLWSIKDLVVFGFSLPLFFGFFLTVYAAEMGGILHGGMIGFICGLACGFTDSPVLAAAGLAYGLFLGIGKLAALSAAAVIGVLMEIWIGGAGMLRTAAPDIIASAVLFAPFVKFGLLPKISFCSTVSSVPESITCNAIISECRQNDTRERVKAASDAFSALSQTCRTLSGRSKIPGIYETRMLCSDVFDISCRHCAGNCVCYDKNFDLLSESIDVIARRLRKNGRIERDDLPQTMKKMCKTPENLISEINLRYARLADRTAENDKTEVFAYDYEAVSEILDGASKDCDDEYELNEILSKNVSSAVGYLDFYANNIAVFGKRKLRIVAGGVDLGRVRVSSDELHKVCENVCMRRLGKPQFRVENDYVTMCLEAVSMISVEGVSASLEKKDETVCGDNVVSFDSKNGFSYILISDGMGSGHDAALTSRVAGVFLRRLLEAGCGIGAALELLNNFIRSRGIECFATIDLLEIDTYTSEAKFVKSGAAPSYVIRDGSLFKVASGTIPVGITREIGAEQIKFKLEKGDVIVMVSDGIAQTLEDSAWLADIIIGEWDDNLKNLSDKILDAAGERNRRRDDMTVGLIRISDFNEESTDN